MDIVLLPGIKKMEKTVHIRDRTVFSIYFAKISIFCLLMMRNHPRRLGDFQHHHRHQCQAEGR